MSDPAWDIDAIVREVLRRLDQPPAAPSAASSPDVPAATAAPTNRGSLRLYERVIALATLDGRLRDVRQVVVDSAAVVTPSVRDLLRKRNVALVRETPARAEQGGAAACVVLVAECGCETAALSGRIGCEVTRVDSAAAAVAQLAQAIRERRGPGVLFTDRAAFALCFANRHAEVRAALGTSLDAAREAVRAIGANLLVVDPRGRSVDDLAALAREFGAAGPQACPIEYTNLLETAATPRHG